MRYIPLKSGQFIVEKKLLKVNKNVIEKKEPTNYVIIFDRSYSMSGLLSQLAEDLIQHINTMPDHSTITLGWFSGEGQYNWIVKGVELTTQSREKVHALIKKNKSPLGTTCFSEILSDTVQNVLSDLEVFGPNIALHFFTDGCPVVSNYNKEIEVLFDSLGALEQKISTALLVGYGAHYNKTLLADMAKKVGGALTHSQNLDQYSSILQDFIGHSQKTAPKIEVSIGKASKAFGIQGKTVQRFEVHGGNILVSPENDEDSRVYYIVDSVPDAKKSTAPAFLDGLYAAALLYSQDGDSERALECLATAGDKYLIDRLAHSYTNTELGVAEYEIQEAITDPEKRFLTGKDTSYLPPQDVFCLLNALEVLQEDSEAYFHPMNKAFQYSRVGAKTVIKKVGEDDTPVPVFKPDKNVKVPFGELIRHDERINVSVRAKINGTIKLSAGYETFGLPDTLQTHIYKTYTLIVDGQLNVAVLPVSCGEKTFKILKKAKLIPKEETWVKYKIYNLHLSKIPVANRAMASGKTSAKELCEAVLRERKLEGLARAYKYLRKQLPKHLVEAHKSLNQYDADTNEWLQERHFVTAQGFSPPTETVTSGDERYAMAFKVTPVKLTLPGMTDFKKKYTKVKEGKDKKGYSKAQSLIAEGFERWEKSGVAGETTPAGVKLVWLDDQLEAITKELRTVRRQIQDTKFCMLLGKKKWDDINMRETSTFSLGDQDFNFEIVQQKIKV